ncbi:expressed unknown protein [Seminavis robusta]|uniref:Uncharacterized protein n=1 Tax=Seminavis robusta TaxID=568900 RepID=A0A9N8DSA5_9STRA|nr:expressed unknown protein [Seminavis robusta]|eukprot:Sro317_g115670.1 n/a (337) ;mRNA; r:6279-7289
MEGDDADDGTIAVGKTLTVQEIGDMRVRDIKRRLQRTHGYGADEVGRMLDKQELIHALAFEEHKIREKKLDQQKRVLVWRGILAALLSVSVAMCWPLLSHAYEVAAVNFVVYTDRKRLEVRRCMELQSALGLLGIVLMFLVDGLSVWLSASILLSWVMTSKYFFPMPPLPIHPAKFMGGEVASGPMSRYGFNVGPMLVSWGLRFLGSQLEKWTGQTLAAAQREMKRKARENETQAAKEERRARKAARRAAREEAAAADAAAARQSVPSAAFGQPPQEMNPAFVPPDRPPPAYDTSPASVEAFLGEEFTNPPDNGNGEEGEEEEPVVEGTSGLDDLD